jgi:hypothetical protein
MKITIQLSLLLFVFLGITASAYSDPMPFHVNAGWSSIPAWDAAYDEDECDGVYELFEEHPIPLGAIDVETGREIVGWEIICDDLIIMSVGNTTTPPQDNRLVPRGTGWIRLHYPPASPPPPPK